MLTGISETQYPMLANGPLTDNKSSGITKIATALIQEHSAYMAEEGPIIWDEIAKIKEYVEKRNSIDEKKMYNEQESQKLLKTTEDVQNILEHISVQEEKFIELTDIVNKNIYNIFNQYLDKNQECEEAITHIVNQVAKNYDDMLNKEDISEEDIIRATSVEMIQYLISELRIGNSMDINVLDYAKEHFDIETYDGFILLQAWCILCHRFDVYKMANMDMSLQYDFKETMEKVLKERETAQGVLDTNNLQNEFEIEDTTKLNMLKDELTENLNINSDYTKNLIAELEELIVLTAQREPKEIDELQMEAGDQEAA